MSFIWHSASGKCHNSSSANKTFVKQLALNIYGVQRVMTNLHRVWHSETAQTKHKDCPRGCHGVSFTQPGRSTVG